MHRPLFKAPPKEYVIPEGDEGDYQESLISVTVLSSKANCHPGFFPKNEERMPGSGFTLCEV